LEKAQQIRELLRVFYTVIKSSGAALRFVMLSGVSKITQTSIFSGLNNLRDITFHREFAGICGYTQQELEDNFKDHILQLATEKNTRRSEILKQIKHWYNGYSWNGETFVYNPFSVLLLFDSGNFMPHWFATGTPSFLLKLLKDKNDLSPLLKEDILQLPGFTDQQVLENLDVVSLCFQTGYLTIKSIDAEGNYHLAVPNYEVKTAFTTSALTAYTGKTGTEVTLLALKMKKSFEEGDVEIAVDYLRTLFSSISYNTFVSGEAHYHALFQLAMNLSGIDQRAEFYTDKGRSDSVLKFGERIYIIEIKYAPTRKTLSTASKKAIRQIKTMKYYQPYLHQGIEVILLALAFTKGDIAYIQERVSER
jgi:hypothetical protein